MRLPVPTNRLVALTLVGAVLTAIVAVGLAVPGALSGGDDGRQTATLPSDAPTPNENFTPAVSDAGGGHEDEEYGEAEYEGEEYEDEEYEDEEHEEEEHE